MHAVREGTHETICELGTGRGSGLVRDGNYWNCHPCPHCWNAVKGKGELGTSAD